MDRHQELVIEICETLNVHGDTYWPYVSVDGRYMLLTVRRRSGDHIHEQEDLYLATRKDGDWSHPIPLEQYNSIRFDEGGASWSADGNYFFFVLSNNPQNIGSADLYYAYKDSLGNWSRAENIGPQVNSKYWDSSPSLTSDLRFLYFASNRPNGYGQYDLWRSEVIVNEDGSLAFEKAQNLGPQINTAGKELAPYVHPNGKVLYFSSDAHQSMGGLDIFCAAWEDADWGNIKNMGAAINSSEDDLGFFVSATGDEAYLASTRWDKRSASKQIARIKLPEVLQTSAVSYIFGQVKDATTEEALDAKLCLLAPTGEGVYAQTRSVKGRYFLPNKCSLDEFILYVKKEKYLHFAQRVEQKHDSLGLEMDIYMFPKKVGTVIPLKQVHFAHDKAVLTDSSKLALMRVVDMMTANPELSILLRGYTDAAGGESYNMELSQQRAEVVAQFLVTQGISEKRVRAKGYGERNALSDNNTEEGKARNRRTELVIDGIDPSLTREEGDSKLELRFK